MTTTPSVPESFLAGLDDRLAPTDQLLATAYPGDGDRRQPVHTVYVPGDRYTAELPRHWGDAALALVKERGGAESVCRVAGVADHLVDQVADRVVRKLTTAPVEDLRIDFEDGYGSRGDDTEDADSAAAATRLAGALADGSAPDFVGLRFKSLERATRRRGLRTLDIFLTTLLEESGALPDGWVLTFPKVSTVTQVEAMVEVCVELESRLGLPPGRLTFEIQVETPQLVLGAEGSVPVARAVHVGAGRVTSLHYGTYDYSASLQIAAAHQASDHPAADFAKHLMQLAVAGTGVHLSDGSTNILPVGDAGQVERAWRIHADLVRRAMARGYYQGWDLHPHQLPTRYAATFAFYRAGMPDALERLAAYLGREETGVLDEPATARALARYLERGSSCGAVDAAEISAATGLDTAGLHALSVPGRDAG